MDNHENFGRFTQENAADHVMNTIIRTSANHTSKGGVWSTTKLLDQIRLFSNKALSRVR
jgi:hypothetical protein